MQVYGGFERKQDCGDNIIKITRAQGIVEAEWINLARHCASIDLIDFVRSAPLVRRRTKLVIAQQPPTGGSMQKPTHIAHRIKSLLMLLLLLLLLVHLVVACNLNRPTKASK